MASARQFQFFFQLTAALGPNFSKTFKTANSTMTLLGDNLKEVRNKLKDVSAYQKQQTAVERSKQRVTDLEKEHERLQAEYDATGGESEKLKKKLEANTEALAKARDKAADETEKLETTLLKTQRNYKSNMTGCRNHRRKLQPLTKK